jgi:hypothetical protein
MESFGDAECLGFTDMRENIKQIHDFGVSVKKENIGFRSVCISLLRWTYWNTIHPLKDGMIQSLGMTFAIYVSASLAKFIKASFIHFFKSIKNIFID